MSDEVIPHEELVEIFNRVLNSCQCIPFDGILISLVGETGREILIDSYFLKDYLNEISKDGNKRLEEIEYKISVFENIPREKIYKVIEDFIYKMKDYTSSKNFVSAQRKELENKAYRRRKKDIKIIEAYQEMIFNYTSDYDYNNDEFSILTDELDEVYQLNKKLLEELKTRNYKTMDTYRYEGTKLYNTTKKPIRQFFDDLKSKYHMKTSDIKQMIDIL